ncbi:MAG: PqqD family peptide modification chaperone, partial [Bacteroidales bacterium]|nr:PqqD family peptide modification chaperone [Bacteroidales bacterium]
MKFFRQTKDTFVRIFDEMGYVTNQLTWQDRIFEETGRDFLSVLKREVQEVNQAVNILSNIYKEIPFNEIHNDFVLFLRDLENDGFILTGDTLSEIDEAEPSFTYNYRVDKINNLHDETLKMNITSTEDYLYQFHKKKPTLFAIQFELTSKCNERCVHCYIPNSKKDTAFSLDYLTLIKTLEEASKMNVLSITLSGGEPFLYKEINS